MNPNYTSELSRERAPRRYSRVYVQTSRRICRNSNCDGGGGLSFSSIEEQLGLTGWSSDGDGIGGLLKIRVEDFRVDEIACIPALDPKGRFTVARVSLNNWETNRFLGRLAKACGISRRRVFSSGMKDKRAVTSQILVIDAPRAKVESAKITDATIEVIGRTHHKIGMSDHDGNRFTITVRGCCDSEGNPIDSKEAMARVRQIISDMSERMGADSFPNWIGPQRFGSTRPVTPEVGRSVIEGDFEKACDLYLGMKGQSDTEDVWKFRKLWREDRNPDACLEIIPEHLGYEKSILESLSEKPEDWLAAFKRLPNSLQLLCVHSLQSLAFNHALAARMDSGHSLIEPILGDLVAPLHANGRIDVSKLAEVTESNLDRCRRNCKLGRLTVTGPLPGLDSQLALGEQGEIEITGLERSGLTDVNWRVSSIPRLTSSGTRRPLSVPFDSFSVEEAQEMPEDQLSQRWRDGPSSSDRWHPEGTSLRMRFSLPPGTYATVLMRELMKSPLNHY